jgi:hypothetical protein
MSKHKCTACGCNYKDDEGGVQGNFGIIYMSFCPTCFENICYMVDELTCPKEGLIIIMNHYGLATEHVDTWGDLLESLEIGLEHKFNGENND